MSSFLDSTGLSRLASKITDYFAKKDGNYSTLISGGTTVTQLGSTNVDLNDYKGGSTVKFYMWSGADAANVANKPFSNASFLVVYPQVGSGGYGRQVCFDRSSQHFVTREFTGAQWTTWREIALDTGSYPDMTVGNATRANTIFEGSSNKAGAIVRSIGTSNTDNNYSGWKKFVTVSASSVGASTACRICGYIYVRDANWAQAPTYKIRFQIILNFTSQSYRIFHTPSSNVSSLIRIVEVSARSNYEIQIKPQGLNDYSFFYAYAWVDANRSGISISWNTDMAVSGSTGTVVSNQYVLDTYAFKVANGQVGSTNRPVYVKSDGSVEACFTGINTIATSGNQYYKLADITFSSDNADIVYAGVQIAATWRNGNGDTGSGIVGITFSEYGTGPFGADVAGRVLVTYVRSNGASFLKDKQTFIVQKNTNYSYTLLLYNSGPQCLSYSLLSGGCTAFTVPSTATVVTPGSNLTKLPYFVPSGTTYTPA